LLVFVSWPTGEAVTFLPSAFARPSSWLLAMFVICWASSDEALDGALLLEFAVSFATLAAAEASLTPMLLLLLAGAIAVSFTEMVCSPRLRTVVAFSGGGLGLARSGSRSW
jgi:hypothetical protein